MKIKVKIIEAPPIESKHGVTVGKIYDAVPLRHKRGQPIVKIKAASGAAVKLMDREYEVQELAQHDDK